MAPDSASSSGRRPVSSHRGDRLAEGDHQLRAPVLNCGLSQRPCAPILILSIFRQRHRSSEVRQPGLMPPGAVPTLPS
jgi:hypothetical protein